MIDAHGNPINKRNAWATRTVLYNRTIPPGAADTVRFKLKVPENSTGKINFQAKLNYRKFDWWHTQWAYAGIRDPNDTDFDILSIIPTHPITGVGKIDFPFVSL